MKKKLNKKQQGQIALLSLLAIASGCGIGLSFVAFMQSNCSDPVSLILFLFFSVVCCWTIIASSKIGRPAKHKPSVTSPSECYCSNCGAEIQSGVNYCGKCGNRVDHYASSFASEIPINSIMKCPRCGGHNIAFQTVTESKKQAVEQFCCIYF